MFRDIGIHFQPQRFIHPSWIEALQNADTLLELRNNISRGSPAERCLQLYLRRVFDLSDLMLDELTTLEKQLLEMDSQQLQKLIVLMGGYVNHDILKQCITREAVSYMHYCLGADGYRYCLLRSPGDEHQFTAVTETWIDPCQSLEFLRCCGLKCLFKLQGLMQEESAQRLKLMLPRDWIEDKRDAYDVRVRGDMEALFNKLYPEVIDND